MKKGIGRVHDTGISGEAPQSVESFDMTERIRMQHADEAFQAALLDHHADRACMIRLEAGTESPRTVCRPSAPTGGSSMGFD